MDKIDSSKQPMLDFDDTFFKQEYLDEIEQEITNSNCKSGKCSRSDDKSEKKWSALSLSSQKPFESEVRKSSPQTTTKSDQKPVNDGPSSADSNHFAFIFNEDVNRTPLKINDDFSQLYDSTQIVRQLDEDILREEVKHNLSSESLDKKRKSIENEDHLFKQPKTRSVPTKRSSQTQKNDPFYFLFEESQYINKVVETEKSNKEQKSEDSDEVGIVECNPSDSKTDDKKDGIEDRVTQLLKSTQYRQEISQLFENLEQSICHFGSKDGRNESWANDSLLNDDILSKFTQDSNTSIGNVIRKALKDNVNKSLTTNNVANATLLPTQAVFKELGTFYGLPSKVEELVKNLKGINELYDWQNECLNLTAIKKRKNLIYSLPTSGGKTLVAEILILREILCRKRNAIFVLPYVSIVQEKVWALSSFAVELDFLVEEYAAGKGIYPPRKRRHKNSVYVATTEKALGLVNSLIETGRLSELGLIVIDELHLIGDAHRGPTLEVLLTKLTFITDDVQIVGMSATIGNLSDISLFLNAEVYTRNFRPVELMEYVKCGHKIAKVNIDADEGDIFQICRDAHFDYSDKLRQIDPDRIGGLVMETIPSGSCLVFCPTKKHCENVAKLLCKVVSCDLKGHKVKEKLQLLNALRQDAGTVCDILTKSVPFGIAYHHSGLTGEERKLIEEAYRRGILCVICCTSTLAAGVNLPAKRVIIRKPYIAQTFINLSRYKQMIGRAGRAGLGEVGESILLCTADEIPKVKQLFMAPMDQTLSKLHEGDYSRLMNLFLSCISLGTATTKGKLKMIVNKTLMAVQREKLDINVESIVRKVIYDLIKLGAVQIDETSNLNNSDTCNSSVLTVIQQNSSRGKKSIIVHNRTKLLVSKLGIAAIKGNLNLQEAQLLYDDLTKAKDSLVLVNCLHLLYLVTPYNLIGQIKPDKNQLHFIMTQLGSEERKTAIVIGITESCMVRMLSNQQIKSVPENVLNRFYMSLMLYELWNEVPVIDVSEKYQVNRGIVQNLMTNAATFATNVVMFCEQLEEFWAFVYLLKGMSRRLSHCCCKELIPLMELPAVQQTRAKQLFQAGFKNLQSIAKADPTSLVHAVEFMSRKVANQLIAAAKMLLLEKVENLREEAEDVLDGVDQK